MDYVKVILKEPLVHFLLIGVGLFLAFHFANGPADDHTKRIVVSAEQVDQLVSRFTRTWMRPPSREEMDGLIESYVRDEIYYREAVAIGLDQNDPTIKQRMRMKLEFMLEDLSQLDEVTDQNLIEFLRAHPDKFRLEPRITFRQVYIDPHKHHDLSIYSKGLLSDLRNGAIPDELGDTTLLDHEYRHATRSDIVRLFGEGFADDVISVSPAGGWSGPYGSQYGVHLVMVTDSEKARLPDLSEIRDQVEREYLVIRRQGIKNQTYRELRGGYRVVIAPRVMAEESRGRPGEALAATQKGEEGQ